MFVIAFLLIIVSLFLLFVFLIFIFLAIDVFLELPYVATDRKKIETILKFANLKKGQTLVDLGSGDGRLLFAAAKRGVKAVGYEINPILFTISRIHAGLKGLSESIKVYKKSLWEADLAEADAILVYSKIKTIEKFEDFVYTNARPGTRVIVNTNHFPNKKPQKSQDGIYLYEV